MQNNKNTDTMKQSISQIVKQYRGEKSLREFAADISSGMSDTVAYTSVKNWEDSVFLPAHYLILAIALSNDDWRREFALKILAILDPDNYSPDQISINS